MSLEMQYTETLIVTHCWCGIAFAIPNNLYDWMHRREGSSCYCPIGHTLVFSNTLQEQNDKLKQRVQATRDLLEAEERSHRATKGQVTRMRKRESAGVCPCCNRSFQNVARHMSTKHPEYAAA